MKRHMARLSRKIPTLDHVMTPKMTLFNDKAYLYGSYTAYSSTLVTPDLYDQIMNETLYAIVCCETSKSLL